MNSFLEQCTCICLFVVSMYTLFINSTSTHVLRIAIYCYYGEREEEEEEEEEDCFYNI